MQQPSLRLVFDRKKTATAKKKALVQIEIVYGRKKKYISTGVYLHKGEWDNVALVIRRFDMDELNERLKTQYKRIYSYINELASKGEEFSFEKVDRFLKREDTGESFIMYAERRIKERNDIKASTKKNQHKIVTMLERYDKIKYFSDLTSPNIQDFYNYLIGLGLKQQSVYSYIKYLKIYIHDAMAREIIKSDPCAGLKFKKGDSEEGRWITKEEVERLESLDNLGFLQTTRDLFLLQCYTGLAYSDLMDLKADKIEEQDGLLVLTGKRLKTDVDYVVVVLPKAKDILERYNWNIPKLSNQKYNDRLKLLSEKAEIGKPLASHWGRRTCGMLLLNNGYPIEVVSKVLGHTDIKTTQKAYAKILSKTIVETFKVKEGL